MIRRIVLIVAIVLMPALQACSIDITGPDEDDCFMCGLTLGLDL